MHTKLFILFILLANLFFSCQNQIERQTQVGVYYMDQQKYNEAVSQFNDVLAINRFWFPAYYNRAIAYANTGEYEKALNDFNFLITSIPDYSDAYFNRAILYENCNHFAKAIQDYSTCINLVPDYIKAYHYRGILLYKMGNYEGALNDYNHAIELGKNISMEIEKAQKIGLNASALYYNRAVVLQKKGEYKSAIIDYDKVILIDPSSAKAYYNRGLAKIAQNNKNEGIKDLQIAYNLGHIEAQKVIQRFAN